MINTYIITGFLGSGKTTFLNHLLAYHKNQSNLVIENEFGDVNIDSQLIAGKVEQVFELTSGCICCSLDSEFIKTLIHIAENGKKPDNLFIETTGIADAGEIIGILNSPDLRENFSLKHCICIIDAQNIEERLVQTYEAAKQITVSDVLVINKVNDSGDQYLKEMMEQINPFTTIFNSSNGLIDFDELERLPRNNDIAMPKKPKTFTLKTKHSINTVVFETDELLDFNILMNILNVNFSLYSHQLYRLKGLIKTNRGKQNYLVQSTGKYISCVGTNLQGGWKSTSVLVFIGTDLKTVTINRILKPAILKNGQLI
jgi:G3E family GTPase